jgi:hypothetical protein
MKKIIKLDESDLLKIINKVLSEQGLGRPIPSNFGQDIISRTQNTQSAKNITTIQTKLKSLGYNLGTSGPNRDGIDGVYGKMTRDAIVDFQRKNSLTPDGIVGTNTATKLGVSPLSNDQIRMLQKGQTIKISTGTSKTPTTTYDKEQCNSPESILTPTFLNRISYMIPVHLRMFLFFLAGRTGAATNKDFTKEEINYITKKVNNFCLNKINCKGNIDFYKDNVSFEKMKKGDETHFSVDIPKQIAYSLGNAQVMESNGFYVLTDMYDFNNFKNNPKAYNFKNIPSTILTALKKICNFNLVQGVEELASFKQASGYDGFPVTLKIKKN